MSYLDWHVGMPVVNTRPVDFSAGLDIAPKIEIGSVYQYGWYDAKLFRPVQKHKTSIEVFERLLNPSDKDKHLIEVFDFVSMQGDLQ